MTTVMAALVLLLRLFAALADVINLSTFTVFLSIINVYYDIISPYGIIFCCYKYQFSFLIRISYSYSCSLAHLGTVEYTDCFSTEE